MQYLYNDGTNYSFMNKETYETIEVSADLLGDDVQYLREGLEVIMGYHRGRAVASNYLKK